MSEQTAKDIHGMIFGKVVTRNGRFHKSFSVTMGEEVTPETLKKAFEEAGINFMVALKMFDEEQTKVEG